MAHMVIVMTGAVVLVGAELPSDTMKAIIGASLNTKVVMEMLAVTHGAGGRDDNAKGDKIMEHQQFYAAAKSACSLSVRLMPSLPNVMRPIIRKTHTEYIYIYI